MTTKSEWRQCKACTAIILRELTVCPNCNEKIDATADIPKELTGTITAFTTIHIAPEKYREDAPYTVVLVRLDNNTNVMGRLLHGQSPIQGNTVHLDYFSAENGPIFSV